MFAKLTLCTLSIGGLVLAGGCASKQKTDTARPTVVEPAKVAKPARKQVLPQGVTRIGNELRLSAIYFDTDSSLLRPAARPLLGRVAEYMKKNPETHLTVEGHCDERGTEAYNLGLGEHRARSAQKYLVRLGVGSRRVRTLSYGELKPAVQGGGEGAWSRNRRSEFVPEKTAKR